jgi:hypothetical protein
METASKDASELQAKHVGMVEKLHVKQKQNTVRADKGKTVTFG